MKTWIKGVLSMCICFLFAGNLWSALKMQPVTLTTSDGWALDAQYQPAGDKEKVILLLHDLGKNKESFSAFEKALTKAGFGYLAFDLRGHGKSTGKGEYKTFAREGENNPFNQMVQDGQAALDFLKNKRVPFENILLVGTGLGANVAAKVAEKNPEVEGVALISPGVNIRDVLSVPSLRVYKGNILLAASANERKGFLEASILRNVAFLAAGEGKVTFLTAYEFAGHELLDKYLTSAVIQWADTPRRPDILPDTPAALSLIGTTDTAGLAIIPSQTEQALVPSVLAE